MIAFGDAENDISMLDIVGKSIAMGNATCHVKQVADYVTDTNNQDGIALVPEKLFRA